MTEVNNENIFEAMMRAEKEARARVAENELTDREYQEIARIQKRFEDVGDIRLSLIRDEATRWADRWSAVRNVSVVLVVGGEMTRILGDRKGAGRLSRVANFIRNFGLATTVLSVIAGGYADFESRDAQIELVVRSDIRKK